MNPIRLLSAAEQVAALLREEILGGKLGGEMPGIHQLAAGLLVNHKTVKAALGLLEKEGLLVPQGAGRRRRILMPLKAGKISGLRVAILDYEPLGLTEGYKVELQHLLNAAGHQTFFTNRSLTELGMDVRRIAAMARMTGADAWVVGAGSREVLEWFAAQRAPVFALFGRRRGLPIAGGGPDKPPVYREVTRRLVKLGHRRIVQIVRSERRFPEPGASEQAFLSTLAEHGIPTGSYNLPDWKETVDGFHELLGALFGLTPPTALIIDEAPFFFAVRQFLMGRGLRVPEDVSLVCADGDPYFHWNKPGIAHISWNKRPLLRRIVRWAGNVARGKDDLRQTLTKAEFVEGGTVGPAKG